jgi:RNA 2',3'-cyclic 3'-phosphodiesterase
MKPQILRPIRVFFAVDLDDKTRATFTKIMDTLKKTPFGSHIRWTQPKSLHMTVRFIGNISPTQVAPLKDHIQKILRSVPPFKIQFDKVLLFPSKLKPEVVAVDVQYSDALQNLFDTVEQALVDFGLPPKTRNQRAHITVGRFKSNHTPNINVNLAPMNISTMINSITLFQSIMDSSSSKYDPLAKIALNQAV